MNLEGSQAIAKEVVRLVISLAVTRSNISRLRKGFSLVKVG